MNFKKTKPKNTILSEYRLGLWVHTGSECSQQLDSKLSGQSNLCACTVFMDIVLLPHFGWHFWKCLQLLTSMHEANHVLIHEICIMKYWLNRVKRCRKKLTMGMCLQFCSYTYTVKLVPGCKKVFLRETVKVQSTQPFKLQYIKTRSWEVTLCVHV